MNKTRSNIRPNIKLAHLKTKRAIMSVVTVAVASLVVAGTFAFAAGTTPQIYVAPSSGTYTVGDDIAVQVRENGNGTAVNVAQFGLTYNTSQLQYTSVDTSGSAFGNDVSPSSPSGEVVQSRFTTTNVNSTDQLIATVHFKALTASTASVGFTSLCASSNNPAADCTGLESGGNAVTITVSGGSYTIQNPATPTCPSGYTGTYPNCVAPSGGGGSGGSSGSGSSGSTSTTNKSTSTSITPSKSTTPITAPDNSQVQVSTPVDVQPATLQPDGLQKVQYYLNNKLVYTANAMPYTYHVDTKHLLNGTYTLKTVQYFTSGRTSTSTQKLIVKNPFSFIQFGLFLRHYIVEILIPFVLIVLAIVLLYYRVNKFKMPKGPGSSTIDKPGAPRHDLNVQGPTIVSPSA